MITRTVPPSIGKCPSATMLHVSPTAPTSSWIWDGFRGDLISRKPGARDVYDVGESHDVSIFASSTLGSPAVFVRMIAVVGVNTSFLNAVVKSVSAPVAAVNDTPDEVRLTDDRVPFAAT